MYTLHSHIEKIPQYHRQHVLGVEKSRSLSRYFTLSTYCVPRLFALFIENPISKIAPQLPPSVSKGIAWSMAMQSRQATDKYAPPPPHPPPACLITPPPSVAPSGTKSPTALDDLTPRSRARRRASAAGGGSRRGKTDSGSRRSSLAVKTVPFSFGGVEQGGGFQIPLPSTSAAPRAEGNGEGVQGEETFAAKSGNGDDQTGDKEEGSPMLFGGTTKM